MTTKLLHRAAHRILDALIRHKVAVHAADLDRYRVVVATTADVYRDAFALVHVAYASLGIERVGRRTMRITPQHTLRETTVFVAYEGDQPVGTMTAFVDSPAGLPLDKDYPAELGALRAKGHRLAEFGSLAVVGRCRHTGVPALLAMAAWFWLRTRTSADYVTIGAHPRAAGYFRALYGFQPLGPSQRHADLHAPVVALGGPMARSEAHVRRHLRAPSQEGIPAAEHYLLSPPACVELPQAEAELDERWKLPEEVFRELFVYESDRLETLDPVTRRYLGIQRSRLALGDEAMHDDFAREVPAPPASGVGLRSDIRELRPAAQPEAPRRIA